MADYIRTVTLTKRDREQPVIRLERGDRDTAALMLQICRCADGVDLAGLAWCIKVVSGENSDIVMFEPEISDEMLTYPWTLPAIAAAETGVTAFSVEGVSAENIRVWQSGIYAIEVADVLEATPGYDPQELSIFERTVAEVGERVRDMSYEIDRMVHRVNEAAENADGAAQEASDAAEDARDEAENAQAAATRANTATNTAKGSMISKGTGLHRRHSSCRDS